MENYQIISFPFYINRAVGYEDNFIFKKKKELEIFCKWYIDSLFERVKMLKKTINTTPGFENWKGDYSPESLIMLTSWFKKNIKISSFSKNEIKELKEKTPELIPYMELNLELLTFETVSLTVDIGMYIAEVFFRNNAQLQWHFVLKGTKNYIFYGRPVIQGFIKNMRFEPTHMMMVQAYGLLDNTFGEDSLKKLYDIWVGDYLD